MKNLLKNALVASLFLLPATAQAAAVPEWFMKKCIVEINEYLDTLPDANATPNGGYFLVTDDTGNFGPYYFGGVDSDGNQHQYREKALKEAEAKAEERRQFQALFNPPCSTVVNLIGGIAEGVDGL